MNRVINRITPLLFAVLLLVLSVSVHAQNPMLPDQGEYIKSMSFPPVWKPHFSLAMVADRQSGQGNIGAEINLGLYRDLMNPTYGALGIVGEAYIEAVDNIGDGGLRLMGESRFFMLKMGADYSFRNEEFDFLVSFAFPPHRGGLFNRGGQIRVDWFPGRDHSFNIGFEIPIAQPYAGRTRAKKDHVMLPSRRSRAPESIFEPSEELAGTLSNIEKAMTWISIFTTPFLDDKRTEGEKHFIDMLHQMKALMAERNDYFPKGRTFEGVVGTYHRELERAFAIASGDGHSGGDIKNGILIAEKAREIILDQIILPYDRLLGQRKKRDSLLGFANDAKHQFQSWIEMNREFTPTQRRTAAYVFAEVVGMMEDQRERLLDRWDDMRFVWIPLHYALELEDHDTQSEIDAIIEKAVNQDFTDGNDIHYIIGEQFQWELARMILETENYHVLWIHDFAGRNGKGDPDFIGYSITVRAYMRALINKVKSYDDTGKIPVYMMFLDTLYPTMSGSRLWLALLEDPLNHEVELPDEFDEWEETIHKTQAELRTAVEESKALQAGLEAYGEKWLRNKIKVHVNMTNPPDFTFRSGNLFKYLFWVPDIVMIDHRKISFHDVTELDPGKGEAIYTGMGVGEHFSGATWDDRAILVRGPALVDLKDEARTLLLSQGFKANEIPAPLRPIPKPSNYGAMISELEAKGWRASAMQVHNLTGYGQKDSNVVKGILYTLMPKGSQLYIPDSLWNSPLWGGMLVGSALRGCRVFLITPAFENAPSDGIPQMSRANELFARFVIIQNIMKEEIESAGGMLKVGIYNLDIDVADKISRVDKINSNFDRYDWLRTVFPFHHAVFDSSQSVMESLRRQGIKPVFLAEDAVARKPKLHFKSQLFISGEAVSTLIPLVGWAQLVRDYLLARTEQLTSESYVDAKRLRALTSDNVRIIASQWDASLTPEEDEKTIFYLTVGSHNMDYRGKIMDGESMYVVSDTYSTVGYLDFVNILGVTTWVESIEELNELLPEYGGFWYKVGRYLKNAV
jgi:phosphatidylserine/phosphatidylglycerophosphate/cardiolipin synthase-like enzyme